MSGFRSPMHRVLSSLAAGLDKTSRLVGRYGSARPAVPLDDGSMVRALRAIWRVMSRHKQEAPMTGSRRARR
jgi:hypothetical protein